MSISTIFIYRALLSHFRLCREEASDIAQLLSPGDRRLLPAGEILGVGFQLTAGMSMARRRGLPVRVRSMCAAMLLHVVLAGEGLVAHGAVDTLLPGMLLPMARGVARGGEGRGAGVRHRVGTRVFVLAQTAVLGRAPVERAGRGFAGRAR